MQIEWNKKYTTISAYVISVFIICLLAFKLTDSWTDTKAFFSNVFSMLSPILIGILIAYFMNFLVNMFEFALLSKVDNKFLNKNNRKRGLSIIIAYLTILSLLFFLLGIIIPQLITSIIEFVEAFQLSIEKMIQYLNNFSIEFEQETYILDPSYINSLFKDNLPNTFNKMTDLLTGLIPNIISLTKELALLLLNIILSLIISIYLLTNKESAKEKSKKGIIALFPKDSADTIFDIATYAHKVFARFFIGKMLDSIIVAIICFLILLMMRMPFPLLISSIVGVTNIIPYFGPFIGGGVGFIFLIFVNPVKALWFLFIIIVLQQLDSNFLEPKIVGESIGLSPFWIIFSIVLFGNLFGFIGLLLGAPVFCVLKTLIERHLDYRYRKRLDNEESSKNAPLG